MKIFETINNRGKDLSNSDIFKANLYAMALNNLEQDEFINRWKRLDSDCDNIGYDVERIFKIYSYQIRGQRGIKSSEIGLRDFFEKMDYSPFKKKTYKEILDDLSCIVDAIEFFDMRKQTSNDELAKWFQLIDLYTNAYPKDTMIIFLVKNKDLDNEIRIIEFAKSLVRQSYAKGSTTTIKYDMYDLTIKTIHNKWEIFYDINYICPNGFGRLYRGFELLEKYINLNQLSIYPYKLKRKMNDLPDEESCKTYEQFFRGE